MRFWLWLPLAGIVFLTGGIVGPDLARAATSCEAAGELERGTAGWWEQCGEKPEPQKLKRVSYVPAFALAATGVPPDILKVRADRDCRPRIADDPYAADRYKRCLANWALEDGAMLRCGYVFDKERVAYTQTTGASLREIEQCKADEKIKLIERLLPDIARTCAQFAGRRDAYNVCIDLAYVYGPRPDKSYELSQRLSVELALQSMAKRDDDDAPPPPSSSSKLVADPVPRDGCRPGSGMRDIPGAFGGKACLPLSGSYGGAAAQAPRADASTDDQASAASDAVLEAPAVAYSGASRAPGSAPRRAAAPVPRVRTTTTTFRPAPRTRQSTITGKEFYDGIRAYDRQQQAIVIGDGRKLSIRPLITSMARVAPRAAQAPFVQAPSGRLQPSPDFQRAVANNASQIRTVGGVALDVTFQSLSAAGLRSMSADGEKLLIENPVLISLAKLLAAVRPYAASSDTWRALPDALRYPGRVSRIRGFVIDPTTEDVFLVGTPADRPETRLDIDLLTVLLDVSWGKGLSPAVSLDPSPAPVQPTLPVQTASASNSERPTAINSGNDGVLRQVDYSAPQMTRLINLPGDALPSRILLDADYEMKRINFGLVVIDDPDFKNGVDLAKMSGSDTHAARFWFHPVPLNANSVRLSSDGNVALFDARLQVLTESLGSAGEGLGEADALDQQTAEEFTRALPRIDRSDAVRPVGIFSLLAGANDIVTLGSILRKAGVSYDVLDRFTKLPYRRLTGSEQVPASYPSQTSPAFVDLRGRRFVMQGGVRLRSRYTRRAYDQFDDDVTLKFEAAAAAEAATANVFVPVPLTFTLAAQSIAGNAATGLLKLAGTKLLAKNNAADAESKLREAAASDPLDIEAWVLLAVAQSMAKKFSDARVSIGQALNIDAHDGQAQETALKIAIRAGDALDIAGYDLVVRQNVSADYSDLAFKKLHPKYEGRLTASALDDADLAVRLNPANGWALFARAYTRDQRKDFDGAIRDYSAAIALLDAPSLYGLRAFAYMGRGSIDAASADFTTLIDRQPTSYIARTFRADIARDRGKFETAIADYDAAIKLAPSYAPALMERGIAYHRHNDIELAIADYRRVLALRPDDVSSLRLLGRAYIDKGDLSESLTFLDRALARDPAYLAAYLDRANAYTRLKKPDEAVASFTKALQLDRTLADAYRLRAGNYRVLNQTKLALTDYNDALAIAPNSSLILKERGSMFFEQKDFQHAAEDFEQALRNDPRNGAVHDLLGHTREAQGDSKAALAAYSEAVSVNAGNASWRNDRAMILVKLGETDKALDEMDAVVRLDPNFNFALLNLGLLREAKGQSDLAIAAFDEAIRRTPDSALVREQRARALMKAGKAKAAILDYDALLKGSPSNGRLLMARGAALGRDGEFARAIEDFTRVTELEPKNATAFFNRGLAFRARKQWEQAIADFSRSIDLQPGSGAAYLQRAGTYDDMGQRQKAYPDYKEAERLIGR